MEIYISKRNALLSLLLVLAVIGACLILLKVSGKTLAQVAGFDTGRGAALAGAESFYSVDYQSGADLWAASLCAVSTEPACDFYQNTVAPFLWPDFVAYKTLVSAEVSEPDLLAEADAGNQQDTHMQVWQVSVALSAPWPQGDGQTTFPAYALVAREEDGWKFERFLLEEELTKYTGGER